MAVVVVFPWAPPTQIERRAATISARSSARWMHREAASPRLEHLVGIGGHGGRDDDVHALLQVRAVVALGHMDAEPLEPAGVLRRRRIAAGDLGTPGVGDRGEGRHPGAADADHVQAPLGKAVTARAPEASSRSARRHPGRASRRAASDIAASRAGSARRLLTSESSRAAVSSASSTTMAAESAKWAAFRLW